MKSARLVVVSMLSWVLGGWAAAHQPEVPTAGGLQGSEAGSCCPCPSPWYPSYGPGYPPAMGSGYYPGAGWQGGTVPAYGSPEGGQGYAVTQGGQGAAPNQGVPAADYGVPQAYMDQPGYGQGQTTPAYRGYTPPAASMPYWRSPGYGYGRTPYSGYGYGYTYRGRGGTPGSAIQMSETPEGYLFTVPLNGAGMQDVQVYVDRGHLVVRSQRSDDVSSSSEQGYGFRRSFGFQRRHTPLPVDADPDRMTQNLVDDSLQISIPRRTERPAGGY